MFKSERHFGFEKRLNSLDQRGRNEFPDGRTLLKQRSESQNRLPRMESNDLNFIPAFDVKNKASKLRSSTPFKLQNTSPTQNPEEPLRVTAESKQA